MYALALLEQDLAVSKELCKMCQSWYIARVYVREGLGFMNIYVTNVLSTSPTSATILAFLKFL
jgi:hypothetical protein